MTAKRPNLALAIAVLIFGLTGSALLTEPIDKRRQSLGLAFNTQIDRAVPPWIMLPATALGSFRGLAVDVLWYRAGRLQDEGKYFEANQLAHLITSLQPRFAQVWSYQAWNMAYNISVATYTPQERWNWVNKGIVLLRDKGIVYNPTAVRLYRELGWIFFHKFGKFMDDMHWYYRRRLAMQWQELLGARPLGATTEQVIDHFRLIVDAPRTIAELADHEPAVEKLLRQLRKIGYEPNQALLREIGKVQMFAGLDSAHVAGAYDGADGGQTVIDPKLVQILSDPALSKSVSPFLAYLRKKVLEEDYHMDTAFMFELMARYGPMDWRHPVSHGCYWSELGIKMASADHQSGSRGQMSRSAEIDLLNTNRQTIHAMQELTRFGRISMDVLTGRLDMMPDPRFIAAYGRAVELARERIASGAFGDVGAASFDQGHENFLLEVTAIEYLYGNMKQAKAYYKRARDVYRNKSHNRTGGIYHMPISEFVATQLRDHLDMMSNTSQFIRAMLERSFDRGLAYNQMAVFDRFVTLARTAHEQYQQDKGPSPTAPQARLKLLQFDELLAGTYLSYMQSPQISLLQRSRAWANAPLKLRQRVADRLLPVVQQQAKQAGFAPQRMFRPPPEILKAKHQPEPPPAATQQDPVQIERQ